MSLESGRRKYQRERRTETWRYVYTAVIEFLASWENGRAGAGHREDGDGEGLWQDEGGRTSMGGVADGMR